MRRPEAGRVNPILDGVRAVLDARRERDTLPPLDGLRLDGKQILLNSPAQATDPMTDTAPRRPRSR